MGLNATSSDSNGDGFIQKYSHDGTLLLQIGVKGKVDSVDGTSKSRFLNASPVALPPRATGRRPTAETPSAPSLPIHRPRPAARKSVVKRPVPATMNGCFVSARTMRARAAHGAA